jgi:hypothetical protein
VSEGTFLDLSFQPFIREPFQGGFVGGTAGVLVDDGGIDDVRVGHF